MLLLPGKEGKSWEITNKVRFSEVEALEREICVVSFLRPLLSISQRDSQNLYAFLSACISVPQSASKTWVGFTAMYYMEYFTKICQFFRFW